MEKISVNKIDKKVAKNNKAYLLVETNIGKMSVFDDSLFDDVEHSLGHEVEALIETSGNYKNIVELGKILGEAKASEKSEQTTSFGRDPKAIIKTDCYRMAVDLCIAGRIEMLQVEATAEDLFTKINK